MWPGPPPAERPLGSSLYQLYQLTLRAHRIPLISLELLTHVSTDASALQTELRAELRVELRLDVELVPNCGGRSELFCSLSAREVSVSNTTEESAALRIPGCSHAAFTAFA